MEHLSAGRISSQTDRVRVMMKENLLLCRQTFECVLQSVQMIKASKKFLNE
jgi:hypothetical protein